jgi:calcineurin-like phosphoesterase family protein
MKTSNSKIFVASDTHFGHANIIKYCERPFADARKMDDALLNSFSQRLDSEAILYFLGDLTFAPDWREQEILRELSGMCRKIFILKGNHDTPSKWGKGVEENVRVANTENIKVIDKDIHAIQHEGKKIVMCHYAITDWDGKFHGSIHLHGHSHGRVVKEVPTEKDVHWATYANGIMGRSTVPFIDNRYDVGVDMYGGPVLLTGDLRYINNPKGWDV